MYRIDEAGPLWTAARPRGGAWLDDDVAAWQHSGVQHVVCLLTDAELIELNLSSELSTCRAAGLAVTHVPVPDRTCPPSARAFHLRLASARADWIVL